MMEMSEAIKDGFSLHGVQVRAARRRGLYEHFDVREDEDPLSEMLRQF